MKSATRADSVGFILKWAILRLSLEVRFLSVNVDVVHVDNSENDNVLNTDSTVLQKPIVEQFIINITKIENDRPNVIIIFTNMFHHLASMLSSRTRDIYSLFEFMYSPLNV